MRRADERLGLRARARWARCAGLAGAPHRRAGAGGLTGAQEHAALVVHPGRGSQVTQRRDGTSCVHEVWALVRARGTVLPRHPLEANLGARRLGTAAQRSVPAARPAADQTDSLAGLAGGGVFARRTAAVLALGGAPAAAHRHRHRIAPAPAPKVGDGQAVELRWVVLHRQAGLRRARGGAQASRTHRRRRSPLLLLLTRADVQTRAATTQRPARGRRASAHSTTACAGRAWAARWVITGGVAALLPGPVQASVMAAVQGFAAFTPDKDPRGEHDCAALEVEGHRVLFTIDCYDAALRGGSPDPADPTVTRRVLTIMLAEEY
jgi:hypothetical protein